MMERSDNIPNSFSKFESEVKRFGNPESQQPLEPERLTVGIITFLSIATIAGSFSFLKGMIPLLNPFSWDPTLAEWDRALHGGEEAYKLFLPLLESPFVTSLLNAAYHFWFFLLFFLVYVACLDHKNPERRNTFLISFGLIWIIGGTVLATIFSSVGPVYYQAFGYGDDFVPLMDLLYRNNEISPVWALNVQEMLIENTRQGTANTISAMPSLHVTSAVLMAIYGFAYRRWAGWLLTAFAVIIQLGSVHLGWHYAIDGYLGLLVAFTCWYIARWLARHYT